MLGETKFSACRALATTQPNARSVTVGVLTGSQVKRNVNRALTRATSQRILKRLQDQDDTSRLHFDKSLLFGREKEIAFIKKIAKEAQQASKSAFVSIESVSGSGKSVLAMSIDTVVPLLASGKFLRNATESYTGFVQLSRDLSGKLLMKLSKEELASITGAVSEGALEILLDALPGFCHLFTDFEFRPRPDMERKGGQLHFAAREFFRALTSIVLELILVIDDMQVR